MKILTLLVLNSLFLVSNSLAAEIEVCFSPKNNCNSKIIEIIDNTNNTLKIAVFSLTSKPITDSIIKAKSRNVDVKVILDKGQSNIKGAKYPQIKDYSVLDTSSGYMHSKYIISDDKILLTGSYNFTNNAEFYNFENFVIIKDDSNLIQKYQDNFDFMWDKFR